MAGQAIDTIISTYQPVAQIASLLRRLTLLIQFAHKQFLSVFDISAQPLHRRHGVRVGSIAFLHCVRMFVRFGENVWIVCRRKHGIELGFVEPLPSR